MSRRRPGGNPAAGYWHAGTPGLRPGMRLLPPDVTGQMATHPEIYASEDVPHDTAVVYVTNSRDLALSYAHLGKPGDYALYRVAPDEPLGVDPDYALIDPPVSFTCPSARILAEEPFVRVSEAELVRRTARFKMWGPNQPMYDTDGYLLPDADMTAAGITSADLHALGPWQPEFIARVFAARLSEELGQERTG